MKINSIVAGAIEGNVSSVLNDRLGDILEEISVQLLDQKESWPLSDQLESIRGFSYLMARSPDSHYKELDLVISEAKQIVCWLIEIISTSGFSDYGNIASVLYLVNLIDQNGNFWEALTANKIIINPKLVEVAERFLRSGTTQIEARHLGDFHKKESQQRITSILSGNNWFEIYNELHHSSEEFKWRMSFSLSQSALLLMAFDKKRTLAILDSLNDIPLLWGVMDLYGKEVALSIALEANSPVLEFSAIAATLPFSNRCELTVIEMELLSRVFLKLSKDEFKFEQWMKILNKYPSRYPQIQNSLGVALARSANITSITQYVNAIDLYHLDANHECRKIVTTCFESFDLHADDSFKIILWRIAFTRWKEWEFGIGSDKEYLFDIKTSALDYAVTKYYQECVSKDERNFIINNTYKKMIEINNMWHDDASKLSSFWYLCLSMLQPLFHITKMEMNKDLTVLMEGRTYTLQDSAENKYFNMLIR